MTDHEELVDLLRGISNRLEVLTDAVVALGKSPTRVDGGIVPTPEVDDTPDPRCEYGRDAGAFHEDDSVSERCVRESGHPLSVPHETHDLGCPVVYCTAPSGLEHEEHSAEWPHPDLLLDFLVGSEPQVDNSEPLPSAEPCGEKVSIVNGAGLCGMEPGHDGECRRSQRDEQEPQVDNSGPLSPPSPEAAEALAAIDPGYDGEDDGGFVRDAHACDVCGNDCNGTGVVEHGRGCFVEEGDGGGSGSCHFPEWHEKHGTERIGHSPQVDISDASAGCPKGCGYVKHGDAPCLPAVEGCPLQVVPDLNRAREWRKCHLDKGHTGDCE